MTRYYDTLDLVDDSAPTSVATSLGVGPSSTGTGAKPRDREIRLELGGNLGDRYVVTEFIGEGGMGAVYRAVDQKLGADVALKVVRGEHADASLREEVRLAQKVTHRNVCRTYDLEEAGGHSFVKMEYVAGETLAKRLKRGPLPVQEAIRIARGLAEGLVAAHQQGIVHRDLKPGNVMLAKDRAVLMDFGIARSVEQRVTGMAGTVGYMAPEQFTGTGVDQRADLYALGCLLFEMLAGQPVFGAGSSVELAARHLTLPPPNVRTSRPEVPRWLARAVDQLLAKDPARRPAGIARLRSGPSSPWPIVGGVAVLAAGTAAAIVFAIPTQVDHCRDAEIRIAGAWNPRLRAQVEQAFLATKRPFAPAAFAGVARALDRYAQAWTASATDACSANEIRREQSDAVRAMREACVGQRLDELSALVQLLTKADPSIVERGDQVVFGLPSVEHCANVAALHEVVPSPPEQRARIDEVHHQLIDARVQLLAGKYLPSLIASQKCIDLAKQVGYEPYVAQAHWIRGSALLATGNNDDAAAEYQEAVQAAIRSDHGDEAANAAHSAAILAVSRGKPGEAKIWLAIAAAGAARSGGGQEFERTRLELEGLIAMEAGDLNAGVAAQEQALAKAQAELGKDDPMMFEAESNVGTSLSKAGAFRKAAPHIERALALREASVGHDHPDVASLLTNLGACYTHMREYDKGRAVFERALAMREGLYGKQSPFLIATLDNYGELLRGAGDLPAALAAQERALAIAKLAPGVENPMYQQIATDYADTLVAAHRAADARALLDDVIAVEVKQESSAVLPLTLAARADAAAADRAWNDAQAFADRAIASYEAAGGKDNPALWRPLTARARVELARGHVSDARALVERAIAVAEHGQIDAEDLTPAKQLRDELAKTKP